MKNVISISVLTIFTLLYFGCGNSSSGDDSGAGGAGAADIQQTLQHWNHRLNDRQLVFLFLGVIN